MDVFYVVVGKYYVFNICNLWVGRGLKMVGVWVLWFSFMLKILVIYLLVVDGLN